MDRARKNKAAHGAGTPRAAAGAGDQPTPFYHENAPLVKTQEALEAELCAYWTACDRHAYPEADQHAARYRTLLHGQRAGAIDARLLRLEQEADRARREQADIEQRLAQLEGQFADHGDRLDALDIVYGQGGDHGDGD